MAHTRVVSLTGVKLRFVTIKNIKEGINMKINRVMTLVSVLVCGLGVTSLAQASMYDRCGSWYLGGQLGYGNVHLAQDEDMRDFENFGISIKDHGLAGRLEAGYNFNQNFALETGAILYSRPSIRFDHDKIDYRHYSLDLLGKFSLPVTCQLSAYAKGGLAWVHRGDVKVSGPDVDIDDGDGDHDSRVRPIAGVGVSYAFNPRFSADVSYLRTFGKNSHDTNLGDADFFGVGLTVKLG